MFDDIYQNVDKSEIQEMDKEREDMIYENKDDYRTQTDYNTNRQQPQRSTGSECARMKSYRSATVCLVLLCVLLLTAVIVLCVLINTNNQQFNIKNQNLTEESDQLLTKYTNITQERDQVLTKYTNITEERNQLLTKYTNITEERDQLLTKYTNITEERDQLLTKYTNITEERDQLLTKYTNITEERDQLITNNTNLIKERDQLLTNSTNLKKEREQLLTNNTNIAVEREQLLTNNNNLNKEREQLLTNNDNLKKERDQLLLKSKNLAIENERLLTNNNNLNKQRDQLTQQKNTMMEILKADGWKEYQSSLYFISSEKKSWSYSRRYCRERGADLIIINNKEEKDFIDKISVENKHWIGLTDSAVEGRWKWVDGSPLSYRSWHTGEPNSGRTENCALKHFSHWADYPCNEAYNYICEKNNFK